MYILSCYSLQVLVQTPSTKVDQSEHYLSREASGKSLLVEWALLGMTLVRALEAACTMDSTL